MCSPVPRSAGGAQARQPTRSHARRSRLQGKPALTANIHNNEEQEHQVHSKTTEETMTMATESIGVGEIEDMPTGLKSGSALLKPIEMIASVILVVIIGLLL